MKNLKIIPLIVILIFTISCKKRKECKERMERIVQYKLSECGNAMPIAHENVCDLYHNYGYTKEELVDVLFDQSCKN